MHMILISWPKPTNLHLVLVSFLDKNLATRFWIAVNLLTMIRRLDTNR